MKKKYLTIAGIISAIILGTIFILIFFITSPVLFLIPVISVEPVTDQNIDANNVLVISGKTNLPVKTHIITSVYPSSGMVSPENGKKKKVARGDVWIEMGAGVWKSWNGTIDIASLESGSYEIVFTTIDFADNFSTVIESGTVASVPFVIGDVTCSGTCIRKREPAEIPFIRVNPLSANMIYEEITGITSLPPQAPLAWTIEGLSGNNLTEPFQFSGNSTVYRGIEGIQRWSVILPECISQGEYRITVSAESGEEQADRPSGISHSREFYYPGKRNSSFVSDENITSLEKIPCITIDSLPDMTINGRYLISGTTDLPAGEMIMCEMVPSNLMNTFNFTIDPRDSSQGGVFSSVTGSTRVEEGSEGENLWTFEIQTYSLEPGRYEVTISNPDIQPGTRELVPATASASRIFTLHGGP